MARAPGPGLKSAVISAVFGLGELPPLPAGGAESGSCRGGCLAELGALKQGNGIAVLYTA